MHTETWIVSIFFFRRIKETKETKEEEEKKKNKKKNNNKNVPKMTDCRQLDTTSRCYWTTRLCFMHSKTAWHGTVVPTVRDKNYIPHY